MQVRFAVSKGFMLVLWATLVVEKFLLLVHYTCQRLPRKAKQQNICAVNCPSSGTSLQLLFSLTSPAAELPAAMRHTENRGFS